jgi:cysteine desulfurase/selenocysteine lyase
MSTSDTAVPSAAPSAAPSAPGAPAPFDVAAIRTEFPILAREVHGKPLVYLDNAATKQKPEAVIRRIDEQYRAHNANVHRGLHRLSEESTAAYEAARRSVARFVNAPSERGCIFTSGVTDSLNLVARAWAEDTLQPGDRIVLTHMEHHSNIVPWQMAAERTGAEIVVAPVLDDGSLDMDAYAALLDERVKLVSMVAASNALGTVNPIERAVALAKAVGAVTVIDAAQAASSMELDVQRIGCDFLAFTGHKVFGPTGIGVLIADAERLDGMAPYRGGGDMIESVSFEGSTYGKAPSRFEAGTPNIVGAIGLGAALDWLMAQDRAGIHAHEMDLAAYGQARLAELEGVRAIGTAAGKLPVFSFHLEWGHAYDVGMLLDRRGIAVRTGHHCTEPLMKRFGVSATTRASCSLYNTRAEIDALIEGLGRAKEMLS